MKKPSNRRVSRLRGRAERMVERRGGDVRPTICRYVERVRARRNRLYWQDEM
jgi:hypothetical protein